MNTRLLLGCIAILFSSFAFAQTDDTDLYRAIDGRFNNPSFDNWGSSHSALRRFTGNGYADGQSEPVSDRPNPREISNVLFAQEGLLNDPVGLSDFTWVFGQFMDHDIALTDVAAEPFNIPVPMGDPAFDPLNFGTVVIPLSRNAPRFGTGSGINNPRQYDNEITAFIDGSGVYGSEEPRAEWLRSHVDGKMKVSRGNMLPYNTVTGEIEGPQDPNAPHMANGTGFQGRMYVAGDVRANENPLLASFHTLFVREHNRQCDLLKVANPDWDDDQLYHHARKIVGGLIQSITYDEWLPAMGVPVLDYQGFNPSVNPQLTNVFSAAAFRVGHTLLNSNIRRLDANGQIIDDGNLTLREAFFNPPVLQDYGMDVYLRGMAEQVQQKMDNRVVDDVRNFLFGPPGAGGLDLASINIARGRDRGLSSYNSIRQDYGLPLLFEFADINPDDDVYQALETLYNDDINKIDPWVAMLSERPSSGSIFGPTIRRIMQKQFSDLRDGDRFFYQNDPVLSTEEKDWIEATTFRDIIMYNSSINLMQENVFEAMPFSEICGGTTVAVDGLVRVHTTDAPLQDVTINVLNGDGELTQTELTSNLGFYDFDALPACDNTILTAQREDDWSTGIDIFDMVAIQRQLLGIEELANPYQFLAADANGDATIDVFDIISISRLILGRDLELLPAPAQPWSFVAAGYEFQTPAWPFDDPLLNTIDFSVVDPADINQGFIAYKRGDVNADADLSTSNLAEGLVVNVPDTDIAFGETQRVQLTLSGEELAGFQIKLAGEGLRITDVISSDLPANSYALANGELQLVGLEEGLTTHTIMLEVRAETTGSLAEMFTLADNALSVAVGLDGAPLNVTLGADAGAVEVLKSKVYPNPFVDAFSVEFATPLPQNARAELLDLNGRLLNSQPVAAGSERLQMQGLDLPAGAYLLRLTSGSGELLLSTRLGSAK